MGKRGVPEIEVRDKRAMSRFGIDEDLRRNNWVPRSASPFPREWEAPVGMTIA